MTLLDFNGRPNYDLDLLNERYSEIDFNQLVFKTPYYDWCPEFRCHLKDYNGRARYFDRILAANNFRTMGHF